MFPEHAEAAARAAARARGNLSEAFVEPWTGPIPADLDTDLLHHLPPPPVGMTADTRVERWRAAFRPGLCFYRRGPGFILVKDTRIPGRGARIRIDQEPLINALLLCEEPVRLDAQDGIVRAALEFLLSESLLLRFGDFITTAPYRMRRWPIPTTLAL